MYIDGIGLVLIANVPNFVTLGSMVLCMGMGWGYTRSKNLPWL